MIKKDTKDSTKLLNAYVTYVSIKWPDSSRTISDIVQYASEITLRDTTFMEVSN
jgi:hypothetical protein